MISERETRKKLIDPQLEKAGWDVDDPTKVGIDIRVDGLSPESSEALRRQIIKQVGATLEPSHHKRIPSKNDHHVKGEINAQTEMADMISLITENNAAIE